jgi:hypothetical protein
LGSVSKEGFATTIIAPDITCTKTGAKKRSRRYGLPNIVGSSVIILAREDLQRRRRTTQSRRGVEGTAR